MNKDKLKGLIGENEPGTVEFKENFDRETIETAVALPIRKAGLFSEKIFILRNIPAILA